MKKAIKVQFLCTAILFVMIFVSVVATGMFEGRTSDIHLLKAASFSFRYALIIVALVVAVIVFPLNWLKAFYYFSTIGNYIIEDRWQNSRFNFPLMKSNVVFDKSCLNENGLIVHSKLIVAVTWLGYGTVCIFIVVLTGQTL